MMPIHAAIAPLVHTDLEAVDNADLEPLRGIIGDARLVGLGESAHFSAELIQLRDRIFRFLVTELGFSTLALESGLAEGLAVDRWVHGDPGELAEVAREGISYGFGRCIEMHEQLAWMRAYNLAGHRPVSFVGIDVPGGCANPGPGVAACLARLSPRPGDDELLRVTDLTASIPPLRPDASNTRGAPAGVHKQISELVDRATAADDDLAIQCARGALRVIEFLDHGLYPAPGRNLRNEVMAENLRWLLARDPQARILVGAHNVHLQRSPSFDGTAPIGALLDNELGPDMVLIGTTRGSVAVPNLDLAAPPARRYTMPAEDSEPTPAHTLDALLDTPGPLHLIDLRSLDRQLLGGITAMQGAYGLNVDLDPQRAFDAVIHTRTITAARGAHD